MGLSIEEQTRIDLAAAFRLVAKLGMHEAVANHFSASVSPDGSQFLLNPKWMHFSRIKASDLLLLNANDDDAMKHHQIDPTAWSIHGTIHHLLPEVKVVMHLHPIHATAISTFKNPQIEPIDQNTARYFNRVAVDTMYSGMADTQSEGARLAKILGHKSRLLMGNHGVMVVAPSIGEAFDDIWTLERACQIYTTALSTGRPLNVLADDVAEKTAKDWEKITDFSKAHFEEMKLLLAKEDPSFAD